jgi:hypothetical protein
MKILVESSMVIWKELQKIEEKFLKIAKSPYMVQVAS